MKQKSKLREARIKAGLTIQELADRAGIQWAYVQAVEVGRLPGSLNAKWRLSEALGMSLKDLWPETHALVEKAMAGDIIRNTKDGPVLIKYETWKGKEK